MEHRRRSRFRERLLPFDIPILRHFALNSAYVRWVSFLPATQRGPLELPDPRPPWGVVRGAAKNDL